jgi:hypothetical protein
MAKRRNSSGNQEAIELAVVLLVRGMAESGIAARLVREGTPRDDAGIVITEARKRIQITASYNRQEQLGLSIRRLSRLVELNLDRDAEHANALEDLLKQDHAVALRAQVELNKLLRLHEVSNGITGEADETDESERADALAAVDHHLRPLFNVPDDYPVTELARMAAERVRMADGGPD